MIERKRVHTLAELRAAYNAIHSRVKLTESPRFYRWVLGHLRREGEAAAKLLDIGCGRGELLALAAQMGIEAVGVDISDAALHAACREMARVRLVLADGERLPFADASFSLVTHLGNLEHFLDSQAGARELARVLAPMGHAAVLLPNAYYSGDLWRLLWTGCGPDHHQPIDRFATAAEWRDLLESSGLRVERLVPYNKFKWWKHLFGAKLAYHFLFLCTRR